MPCFFILRFPRDRKVMNFKLYSLLLFVTAFSAACTAPVSLDVLDRTISAAQEVVVSKQDADGGWTQYPPYLGTNFISEYILFVRALEIENTTKLNLDTLKEMLLTTQEDDGSWFNVVDENVPGGDVDTTLMNYWALKIMGEDINSELMTKARVFIVQSGGIDALQTMTKCKLAMFKQYDWNRIQHIPFFIFRQDGFFKYSFIKDWVSQWVYPHLIALAYTRHYQVTFDIPSSWEIPELYSTPPRLFATRSFKTEEVDYTTREVINRAFEIQQPHGSFGTYTVSSILCSVALKDYARRFNDRVNETAEAVAKAVTFVEWLYFDTGPGAYRGVLDDGHWWDTMLLGIALAESSYPLDDHFKGACDNLVDSQQANGGIPYGWDFEYAVDFDDTAETLILWNLFDIRGKTSVYEKNIAMAEEMLFDVQNDDGGYGAFDKNRVGNWVIRTAVSSFLNSAEVFDQSSVDLTAHVMEALAGRNYTSQNNAQIRKMVEYIKGQQVKFGGFEGRWGNNYVYGTGAALVGLAYVQEDMTQDWIAEAINWLLGKQNDDGGWGESCFLSYRDPPQYAGVGKSTPSQTSWALLGLLATEQHGGVRSEQIENALDRGMQHLVDIMDRDGVWFDYSAVGTGHRGILYMQYPSYAVSWPLMALGRYRTWKYSN